MRTLDDNNVPIINWYRNIDDYISAVDFTFHRQTTFNIKKKKKNLNAINDKYYK